MTNSESMVADEYICTHPNVGRQDSEPNGRRQQLPLILSMVPLSVWCEILEYCRLSDVRHLYQTCRWFFVENVHSLESTRRYIALEPTFEEQNDTADTERTEATTHRTDKVVDKASKCDLRLLQYEPVLSRWNQLVAMGIVSVATDETLYSIQLLLPNLKYLALDGSLQVTDAGIMSLTRSSHRQKNLKYLEITFCAFINYRATLNLRRHMHPDLIIRRIPTWIEGVHDINLETHTYFVDGSFTIEKQYERWCGYIDSIWFWKFHDYHQYGHGLKFTNNMDNGEFTRSRHIRDLSFRPTFPQFDDLGCYCDEQPYSENVARTVLVATSAHVATRLPGIYLDPEWGSLFPVGESQYFNREEGRLEELSGLPVVDAVNAGAEILVKHVLVSPLPHRMPPPLVVEHIQTWIDHFYRT